MGDEKFEKVTKCSGMQLCAHLPNPLLSRCRTTTTSTTCAPTQARSPVRPPRPLGIHALTMSRRLRLELQVLPRQHARWLSDVGTSQMRNSLCGCAPLDCPHSA